MKVPPALAVAGLDEGLRTGNFLLCAGVLVSL